VLAKNAGDDVSNEAKNGQVFNPSKESSGKSGEIAAGVLYGVGGAAAVAGAVFVYLGYREAKRGESPRALVIPIVGPQHAGVSAVIRF